MLSSKMMHFVPLVLPDARHHLLKDGGVDLQVEVVVLRHDLPTNAAAHGLLYQERHLLPGQVQHCCFLKLT